MIKSDKVGVRDALGMSAVIGIAFGLLPCLVTGAWYVANPSSRSMIEENLQQIALLAGVLFAAGFGLSLRWTSDAAFRASRRHE